MAKEPQPDEIDIPVAALDGGGDLAAEIAGLARRHKRVNGLVMTAMNWVGGKFEAVVNLVPKTVVESLVTSALDYAMSGAAQGERLPDPGRGGTMAAVMASGAVGGAGGFATALPEIPVTVMLILHAIRQEARAEGFDPDRPEIRAECLRVFSAGGPLEGDDGIDTGFFSVRLATTGPAVQQIIATVAPRLAVALGQKLAAQAVPVIGAVTGAALNATFLDYYRTMARIRFALLRLSAAYGEELVMADFRAAVGVPRLKKADPSA